MGTRYINLMKNHMFITFREGSTHYRMGDAQGSNPAAKRKPEALEDHWENVAYFVKTFHPRVIEIRSDI